MVDYSELLSQINFLVPRQNSTNNNVFYCDIARTSTLLNSPISNICTLV